MTVAVLPNGQAGLVGLEADKAPFAELKGWRVLRGWKPRQEWTSGVADDARRLGELTERDASAEPAPDLAKERVVVLDHAAGLNLKVESNGNVTRVQAVRPLNDTRQRREGVVIAIPRNHQKLFGENGRRLADAEPEMDEMDR